MQFNATVTIKFEVEDICDGSCACPNCDGTETIDAHELALDELRGKLAAMDIDAWTINDMEEA